jgi:hypothetical protein
MSNMEQTVPEPIWRPAATIWGAGVAVQEEVGALFGRLNQHLSFSTRCRPSAVDPNEPAPQVDRRNDKGMPLGGIERRPYAAAELAVRRVNRDRLQRYGTIPMAMPPMASTLVVKS